MWAGTIEGHQYDGTETARHLHSFFSPFVSPTRMTLYVGKDEAGFYVSKALVHTGVALVVRKGL